MRSITPDLDIPTTMNIDHTFIYPHLIYGVEFFGHAENFHLNQIYLLQKSALRVILAIRPRSHVSSCFSEFKGFTLYVWHFILFMAIGKSMTAHNNVYQ